MEASSTGELDNIPYIRWQISPLGVRTIGDHELRWAKFVLVHGAQQVQFLHQVRNFAVYHWPRAPMEWGAFPMYGHIKFKAGSTRHGVSKGYDDIPKEIPDPGAKKPKDLDDEEDGEWTPPTTANHACLPKRKCINYNFTKKAVSVENGQWQVKRQFKPVCKPGGHGVIWKLAYDKGIFQWFYDHGRNGATVRQVRFDPLGIGGDWSTPWKDLQCGDNVRGLPGSKPQSDRNSQSLPTAITQPQSEELPNNNVGYFQHDGVDA
ncbi:calreticulin 1a [Actinidia rufa]|uniref:Calreticulin 1a n=1 Tax=Actinidia rufa TaxID=165716 RepID=A0A7J0DSP6_9ERIC|nr:calreticulin 1a [Actinidia rufa]